MSTINSKLNDFRVLNQSQTIVKIRLTIEWLSKFVSKPNNWLNFNRTQIKLNIECSLKFDLKSNGGRNYSKWNNCRISAQNRTIVEFQLKIEGLSKFIFLNWMIVEIQFKFEWLSILDTKSKNSWNSIKPNSTLSRLHVEIEFIVKYLSKLNSKSNDCRNVTKNRMIIKFYAKDKWLATVDLK